MLHYCYYIILYIKELPDIQSQVCNQVGKYQSQEEIHLAQQCRDQTSHFLVFWIREEILIEQYVGEKIVGGRMVLVQILRDPKGDGVSLYTLMLQYWQTY
jgi:hypothetical protein